MSKLKLYIISANMLLVLGFFFFNIIKNESILNDGKTVLLELRPVDPRSIMQGDYMALRFSLGVQTSAFLPPLGRHPPPGNSGSGGRKSHRIPPQWDTAPA